MLESAFADSIQTRDEVTWDSTENRVRARRVRTLTSWCWKKKRSTLMKNRFEPRYCKAFAEQD
jgi:hypothetical protein